MNTSCRLLVAFVAMTSLSSVASGKPAPVAAAPATTRFSLGNGLDVVIAPDPTVASVVVHVWFHVGSKDEVAGKTGFAHLFEHLMFKGSRDVPDGKFDVLLESAGGWNNGTTNNDRTNFFEQVPANQLELALYLEANRMAGLWDAMNQSVLDNQRDVVKNERRQSYENRPYGQASLDVQQALWPAGHGNHNLTIGTMADLSAASLSDVEAFWRMYYRPSNATLVIAGGVDTAATRALVEKYFAWMPTQKKPTTATLDKPVTPLPAPVVLTATDNVTEPKVSLTFRTDAPYTPAAADFDVLAQILGGSKTSRLYKRLVMKERLATEVNAGHSDQVLGGELTIPAVAKSGVNADALRKALRQELATVRATNVSDDEIARAITSLTVTLWQAQENISTRAGNIAQWTVQTNEPNFAPKQIALWRAVTPDRIRATANAWLADSASLEMTVTPRIKASK
jgi:zinc protease